MIENQEMIFFTNGESQDGPKIRNFIDYFQFDFEGKKFKVERIYGGLDYRFFHNFFNATNEYNLVECGSNENYSDKKIRVKFFTKNKLDEYYLEICKDHKIPFEPHIDKEVLERVESTFINYFLNVRFNHSEYKRYNDFVYRATETTTIKISTEGLHKGNAIERYKSLGFKECTSDGSHCMEITKAEFNMKQMQKTKAEFNMKQMQKMQSLKFQLSIFNKIIGILMQFLEFIFSCGKKNQGSYNALNNIHDFDSAKLVKENFAHYADKMRFNNAIDNFAVNQKIKP